MIPQFQHSLYHRILRVVLCVMACVLVFDSGLFSSATKILSNNTQMYLANAVSVSVGVPANEMNTLTAEITKLRGERDLAIGLSTTNVNGGDRSTFILSVITFILLVLVLLNYALDFARARERMRKSDNAIPGVA